MYDAKGQIGSQGNNKRLLTIEQKDTIMA